MIEPEIFKKYLIKPNLKGINGYKFTFNGANMEICHKKKALLDETIRAVANKHDSVMIYTGYEGTGKTTDALIDSCYIAHVLQLDLNELNIHFLPEDVEKAVVNSPVGTCHIWDEAVFALDSADTMSSIAKALRKVFTVCRSRRQFVFLVIPNVWMLNKYFATVRSRFLVHHICPDGVQRGFYRVYGRKNKNVLYNYGKKAYSYSGRNGPYKFDFEGKFIDAFNLEITKKPLIDEKTYSDKKQKALESLNSEPEKKEKKVNQKNAKRAYLLAKELQGKHGYGYTDLGKVVGEPRATITSFLDSTAEKLKLEAQHIILTKGVEE